MIQANDLRIGNWVEHNANWCYRSPAEIKPFKFQWEERDWYAVSECTMSLEDLHHIPLTIELLENNFGFIAKKGNGNLFDYNFYVKNGFTLAVKMHGFANGYIEFGSIVQLGGEYNCNGERFDRVRYVGSVHQLQNLYFALTGEELNIKL